MIIPKEVMKLLISFQSPDDARTYCRGINIYSGGYAAATNGTMAYISNKLPCDNNTVKDMIIEIKGLTIGKAVAFEIDCDNLQLIALDKESNRMSYHPFAILEGQPVNFKRFVSNFKPTYDGECTFDPAILKMMSVFPAKSNVTFKMGQKDGVSLAIAESGVLILMAKTFREIALPELLL